MSIYAKLTEIGKKYHVLHKFFRPVFNWTPMYRRTTAKVISVSEDFTFVAIKIPLSYKNKNYNGSLFGGSLFSAVDPIPMVQLTQILDSRYVVWDKSAEIFFKRPAKEDVYAQFEFNHTEIAEIKENVKNLGEYTFVKTTELRSKDGEKLFCVVNKTLYVADKKFYKEKEKNRSSIRTQTSNSF